MSPQALIQNLLLLFSVTSALPTLPALSKTDLALATQRAPRPHLSAPDFETMTGKLNRQLVSLTREGKTKPCAAFSLAELQALVKLLAASRDPQLQNLYRANNDSRIFRHDTEASLDQHQQAQQRQLTRFPDLAPMAAAAKCHDAVMLFTHHLSQASKTEMLQLTTLPLLPPRQYPRPTSTSALHRAASVSVHTDYVQASSCAAGHIIGAGETQYSPGCLGSKECPKWPEQFSAPFGLYSTLPSIKNASSMFYYKVLNDSDPSSKLQLVDYKTYCFPFVNLLHYKQPCKLYFNAQGIFLSQPGRVNCCQFNSGNVSAVPLQFLHSFKLKESNVMKPDFYGNQVSTDHWEGPLNFEYWTVGHNDKLYKNWGHDIVFKDGPTGVTWQWGNFDVSPQDDSLFKLPGSMDECSKKCPTF